MAKESLEQHLLDRGLQIDRYSGIYLDDEERVVTFLVWNLSGQLVGYSKYRPDADKLLRNLPNEGRYYTFFAKRWPGTMLGVWGLETLEYRPDVLCLTEGVFDAAALHRFNVPAIAVFTNDPAPLRPWLYSVRRRRRIVVFRDSDSSGAKLEKYGDDVVVVRPEKDLGDSSDDQVRALLSEYNGGKLLCPT